MSDLLRLLLHLVRVLLLQLGVMRVRAAHVHVAQLLLHVLLGSLRLRLG